MTAGVNYVFERRVNDFSPKKKSTGNVSRPRLSGKVAAIAVGRGKCGQTQKIVSYKYLPVILERS